MPSISLTRTLTGTVSNADANLNNNWSLLEALLNGAIGTDNIDPDVFTDLGTLPDGGTDGQILTIAGSDPVWAAPAAVSAVPAGGLIPYAGAAAPAGWLLCDGAAVSRTTFAALFAAIGTAYGSGNGSTTFNVPNLKGKVPVGQDGAQNEFDVLGESGGAKTHTLSTSEMPSHTHTFTGSALATHNHTQNAHHHGLTNLGSSGNTTATGGAVRVETTGGLLVDTDDATATNIAASAGTPAGTNASSGSGGAHNNLQPYQICLYIIKT